MKSLLPIILCIFIAYFSCASTKKASKTYSKDLFSEDSLVRETAAIAIIEIGRDAEYALPYLLEQFSYEDNAEIRRLIIEAIGSIRPEMSQELNRVIIHAIHDLDPEVYIVLRLAPKNTHEEFEIFENEVDFISHKENPLEILFAADVVVGMTTTLLLEAVLMGKNVLSVLPKKSEKELLSITRNDVVPCIWERQKLNQYLKNMLSQPNGIEKDYPEIKKISSFEIHSSILQRVSV